MPSQHPHPSQRQHSEVTVRQTGPIPHHLLYHHNPHDRKNDHSCSEYSTRNSDSIATQTPHIHHQARGARLGVNLRYPTPRAYTCLGRGLVFLGRKCVGGTHVCSFFMCVLRVLHYIQFLPFGVLFARAWTLGAAPLLCFLTRTHFHFRSSPHFRRRSLRSFSFFSNEHFLFHLISSHLKTSIINQSSAPCHSTIPQYLYFYSLQGVKTPLLLSCMFFLCHYCFVVRPVARASLRSRGTTVFPFWPPFPTPLHHSALITPPTRFSEIFTRTNTYTHTQSSHLLPTHPRLYHQQQMSNEKKNPLSRRRCVRLGLQR